MYFISAEDWKNTTITCKKPWKMRWIFKQSAFSQICSKQAGSSRGTGKFFVFRHLRQEIEIRSTTATLKGNFALSCGSKRGWQLVTLLLFTYLVHFLIGFSPREWFLRIEMILILVIYLRSKKERENSPHLQISKPWIMHVCK